MTTRTFAVLFLSTMVGLPVFAQQSDSGSSSQGGATANQSSQPAHESFWGGDEPSLGALIFRPFASKQYVRRHYQPIRDRVNELEELTSANTKAIRDVEAQAQRGIQLASAKVSMANEHAMEATTQAQTAQQSASAISDRVGADEKFVGSIDQFKPTAQTEIRFRPGQTVLSKEAKDALDELTRPLKDQHAYILEVQSFASGQGQAAIANSRKMADAVVRYLVLNYDVPAYRIYVLAMGNASDANSSKTRVEINVLKNETNQIAKQ